MDVLIDAEDQYCMLIAFGGKKHFILFLITSTETFGGPEQECAVLEMLRQSFILLAGYIKFYRIFKREGENQMLQLIELSQSPQKNMVYSPGLKTRHFVMICLRHMNKSCRNTWLLLFFF